MGSKSDHDYYESSRPEMLAYVPDDARSILDIGCAAGEFGHAIKKRQPCSVWGVEYLQEQAQKAAQKLDRVVMGDIAQVLKELPPRSFDCIVCNDILEHLADPFTVLSECRNYISPGGWLVASIPNLRYYRVFKELVLRGEWEYADAGVLDRTHLRFFTRRSILNMFPRLGWQILQMEGINPTSSRTYRILNALLLGTIHDVRYRQFALVCQTSQN